MIVSHMFIGKVKRPPVIQGFEKELTDTSKKSFKDSKKSKDSKR